MRPRKREHLEMSSLQFIIKFRADEFADKMAFPLQLASSKEMAQLAEVIYLKGPSGNLWEAKLSKRGIQLYLEDGWKEFIYDHHVMEDDYLVFNYCGKSCFSVLFFEKSGCEKAAAYFVIKGMVSASTKALQAQRKCVSNSDDKQCSSDDSSFSGGFYGSETCHFNRNCLPDQSLKSSKTEKLCVNQDASTKLSSFLKTEKMIQEMKKSSSQAEVRALSFAKSISKRNPCFLKLLTTSSIRTKLVLVIPNDFVVEFRLFNPQIIILQNPNKKEWLVEYTRVGLSCILLWKNFVKENRFKRGDVCVFELTTTRPKMVMVVHTFRA